METASCGNNVRQRRTTREVAVSFSLPMGDARRSQLLA
ncbi:hypothetical protein PLANPX_5272 [Lacipirellula parvula]|uniref:Uncharacterized protein n=1 Tax=Lacipirellula parvula TaxID=2650471 RepID=A0A5K7XFS2_9BACT|nr:hypothetical protein PLANPX_5272 [Lacipirellula parvula]